MIIVLIGGTCVGKTSVMRKLAELLSCSSRSCGGRALQVATDLGISLGELSSDSHRAIDSETLTYCEETEKPLVVDGRFLHFVLSGQNNDIKIVELKASPTERARRSASRLRNSADTDENTIQKSDQTDQIFCERMYPNQIALRADVVIDTTNLGIEEVASEIISILNL